MLKPCYKGWTAERAPAFLFSISVLAVQPAQISVAPYPLEGSDAIQGGHDCRCCQEMGSLTLALPEILQRGFRCQLPPPSTPLGSGGGRRVPALGCLSFL